MSSYHPSLFYFKHRRWATRHIVCTLLVIVSLLLTACGGSQANGSKSSVLTVVQGPAGQFTNNFNPWLNGSPGTNGFIYETLFHWNKVDGKISPLLASSQKFTNNATGIDFMIHQGIKWSDGQPFSADDVLFTFNLLHKTAGADVTGIWSEIKSVSEPNSNTIHIEFKQASSTVLWDLASIVIVPKHIWSTIKGDPSKNTNTKPVGTGPFVVKSFAPQLVTYERNPNYWQAGKPAVQEIRFPAYNDNAPADLALSQGSIDWGGLFTPSIDQTYVNRDSAHNHYWFPPDSAVFLEANLTKWPFNQLAVRQAMSAGIDRNQLDKTGEDGYEPSANPTGVVLPNQQQWLDPQYANLKFGAPDIAKATSLLQSNGFTKGHDGIYVGSNGKRLAFKLNVISGWTDFVTDCQIMASNLKAIGMDVKVNVLQYATFTNDLQNGTFDTAIYGTGSGPTPYWYFNAALNSKYALPVGQSTANNPERWKNPESDRLLAQYQSSTDINVQKKAMYGLEKIFVEQMPMIPLVYGAVWYEYNTKHFTGWPTKDNPYAVPAPWASGPDIEAVVLNLRPV